MLLLVACRCVAMIRKYLHKLVFVKLWRRARTNWNERKVNRNAINIEDAEREINTLVPMHRSHIRPEWLIERDQNWENCLWQHRPLSLSMRNCIFSLISSVSCAVLTLSTWRLHGFLFRWFYWFMLKQVDERPVRRWPKKKVIKKS